MTTTLDRLKNLKHGATLFGKFYPTDYLVAVFATPADCQAAVDQLAQRGFAEEDVVVASGDLIQDHQADIVEERGFLDSFFNLFSDRDRFAKDVQAISEYAEARFVLIYAPTAELTDEATQAIAATAILAQKYEKLGFHQIAVPRPV